MLSSSIIEFTNSIIKLKEHLSSIDSKEKILEYISMQQIPDCIADSVRQLKDARSEEKVFNYNANVISLYGYLERYIENVIKEYVRALNTIETDFSRLPGKVQKSYFDIIKNLHGKLAYPKYNHFREKHLVDSLYHSLSEQSVDLIAEAFFKNGGNYRYDIIKECIDGLGLQNFNLLYKYPALNDYFVSKRNIKDIEQAEVSSLYYLLNDLVDRRNDIAHGETNTDLLTSDIFIDYIEFLEISVNSINSFLNDALLEVQWSNCPNKTFKPYRCFGEKKVIAVNELGCVFSKGDKLIAARPHGHFPRYTYLSVESMELNHMPVDNCIIDSQDKVICLNVGKKLTEKWRLKVV